MTIWEKAVLNMQKGAQKITVAAATFSERVRAEIAIIRLRIRIDEVQSRREELERLIGRTLVELKQRDELPKSTDLLLKHETIATALNDLADRNKEMEELHQAVKNEEEAVKPATKQAEDIPA